MDLAATAAKALANRMSLLWACWSSCGGGQERHRATRTDDHTTIGSGQARQSDARDSELLQVSRRGMSRVIALTNHCTLLSEACRVTVLGRWFEWTNESQREKALLMERFKLNSTNWRHRSPTFAHKSSSCVLVVRLEILFNYRDQPKDSIE
jgi:hypothetical protein